MIKRLLVTFCLFLAFSTFAQESSSSPYSYYGIGELRFRGTAEDRAMGGISVLSDSIHLNLQNPSFYSNIKLTNLSLGASHSRTRLETNSETEKAKRTSLDYLAIGIPMGKFGAGFGLMAYSAVGYKIAAQTTNEIPGTTKYQGTGGITKAFVGASYKLTKHLNFGAEFGYYFGDIHTTTLADVSTELDTRETNESTASGSGFNFGLSYTKKITPKLQFTASAMYAPESKISFSNDRKLATIQQATGGQVVVDEEDIAVADTKIKLPSKTTFGAGIGELKKWMVGTEIALSNTKGMGNRFEDIEGSEYKNGFKYSVGGYYIPNYASFSSYFKKIVYRGGFRYENTGLVLNGKEIKDVSGSLGLGLPLGGTFSNINLGVEYGKRGTKDAFLVEENYVNFTIGLSFSDRWFVKRKYD